MTPQWPTVDPDPPHDDHFAADPGPPPSRAETRRRRARRRRRWWREWRSRLRAWWSGATADELRAAWEDTRRAPGFAVLGLVAVLWPASGFSLLPVGAAVVAWLLLMLVTLPVSWWKRRRVGRVGRPLIAVTAAIALAVEAGPLGFLLAVGLWLVAMGASTEPRARWRTSAWILRTVARAARVDPGALRVEDDEWDGRLPLYLEVDFASASLAAEDPAVRERVAAGAAWALRHAGQFTVQWPAGQPVFHLTASNPLPETVLDRLDWGGAETAGLPVGVTDPDTANGTLSATNGAPGDPRDDLPIALVNPAEEKHYLVVGGTGGGKTNFIRGFLARGLRLGHFPGGVFLFDGKSGSDFIPFEDREGVHCVARTPQEWDANLAPITTMMTTRYAEDAEYQRGHRGKPDAPRFLIVLDEVQEIMAELGKDFEHHLRKWARQVRAANGRLVVATQRPDAKDAVPGVVKDMLENVFIFGYVSPVGAREALPQDWRAVVDEYGEKTVQGRGMAKIGGKLLRLQAFQLDLPREKPWLEPLYPPKCGAVDSERPSEGLAGAPVQWAPRPQAAAEADPEASTPPSGVPVATLEAPAGVPGAPPDVGEGRRSRGRRRRTI